MSNKKLSIEQLRHTGTRHDTDPQGLSERNINLGVRYSDMEVRYSDL